MTDREIIDALIDRDNVATRQFFYVKCRPLLLSIMRLVFDYPVDYDEMVSELYAYLMANDCAKLRQFQFRSSVYQWLKVVATRFFIRHRNSMIENQSQEALLQRQETPEPIDSPEVNADRIDVEQMLAMMPNRRYADTIRHLVLEEMEPEQYAAQIGVTVDNLYNIKKRAITAFAEIAKKHYSYGR